jgi:coatomer subunit beta
VYAEAYVNVHQFDINLGRYRFFQDCAVLTDESLLADVLIVNQTPETLQNLSVEFATLGDLKISERPTQHTLGPHSFQSIKTTIKVILFLSL